MVIKKKISQASVLSYFNQDTLKKSVCFIWGDASVLLLAKVGTLDGIISGCLMAQETKCQAMFLVVLGSEQLTA